MMSIDVAVPFLFLSIDLLIQTGSQRLRARMVGILL